MDPQLMFQEVEFGLENAPLIGDWRGCKPASADVERHLPPVIEERTERETNLPLDLRPHVQRVLVILPRLLAIKILQRCQARCTQSRKILRKTVDFFYQE